MTTTKGCEGIDVKHSEHLIIADDPESFVSAFQWLFQEIDLRNSVTRDARTL